MIVASKGGDDDHPAWFLNLRDNPSVTIETAPGEVVGANARIATASERARMWPKITSVYANYGGYQKKTSREIPLVILEPTRNR